MKIVAVDVWRAEVPLRGQFKNAHGVKTAQTSVVVRLRTDAGLEGAGNVDPDPGYSESTPEQVIAALTGRIAPALVGHPAVQVRGALARMDRAAPRAWDAHAAVEMALLDLNGQALGVPVHRLLGGALKERIELNGWIGVGSEAEAVADARRFAAMGYRSAKIKVGAGVERDRDRVAAVRAALPDLAIRVDANEGFDVPTAIALGRALAPYGVTLLEQPVARGDIAGLAAVRRAIDIPVMADEAIVGPETLLQVIREEAADIVKVKVMKQGGLLRCLQAIDLAAAAGVRCVIGHGFGLTLNTLAELHVAAVSDNVLDACECVGPVKMGADVVRAPLVMPEGATPVPQGPGLGAALDPVALEKYATLVSGRGRG